MPLVIFIDDCETSLEITKMMTSSMPIDVKQYMKAEVALDEIKSGMTPDLIITDLHMPGMNGFDFLKSLLDFSSTKRTPCLMLTSETKSEIKEQGKALGFSGWMVKPVNSTQLKQAITKTLRLPA
ncbi:MAG: response regulator [Sulfurimonas sp.]|nr:response regulator [Sulfurimonas sp.]